MSLRGARYIHILMPCPLGWGAASSDTIRLARLAKETGVFPVFEAEGGEVTGVLKIRRPLPVEEDYLRPQKRFTHLFGKVPALRIQRDPKGADLAPFDFFARRGVHAFQCLLQATSLPAYSARYLQPWLVLPN